MPSHNPRCAIFRDPPSLRSAEDCNCGAIPPLPPGDSAPASPEGMTPEDPICARCDRPESEHVPGPPRPPKIPGHLGYRGPAKPGCCNKFQHAVPPLSPDEQRAALGAFSAPRRSAPASLTERAEAVVAQTIRFSPAWGATMMATRIVAALADAGLLAPAPTKEEESK